MKYFEMSNGFKSRPILYLDMDGVLADMDGAVASHHGVEHWRLARKKFDKVDKVARNPGFFLHLDKLPNAMKLVYYSRKLAGNYSILSSPLLSNTSRSVAEKTQWIRNNLRSYPPENILFAHEKFKYAKQSDGTPNILVDDYETNIRLWCSNGGVGILYKPEEVNKALRIIQNAFEGNLKKGKFYRL